MTNKQAWNVLWSAMYPDQRCWMRHFYRTMRLKNHPRREARKWTLRNTSMMTG